MIISLPNAVREKEIANSPSVAEIIGVATVSKCVFCVMVETGGAVESVICACEVEGKRTTMISATNIMWYFI